MPADTPAFLVQALEGQSDYAALKVMRDNQATFLSDHSKSHNLRVQLIDEAEQHDELDRNQQRTAWLESAGEGRGILDLPGIDPASQDVILAVMNSQGFRGKVRSGPAR